MLRTSHEVKRIPWKFLENVEKWNGQDRIRIVQGSIRSRVWKLTYGWELGACGDSFK